MSDEESKPDRIQLTVNIVTAFLNKNEAAQDDVAPFVRSIYQALAELDQSGAPEKKNIAHPHLNARNSVTPDYLISFEDGRRYKALRRHLASRNLTPEQYREKWGLPPDYPMVALSHTRKRSAIAKEHELGLHGRVQKAETTKKQGRGRSKRHSP